MKDKKRASVVKFLVDAKRALAEQSELKIADRKKNNESLAILGLTKKNQEDTVYGLQVEDYSAGPEPDRDRPGHVWKFGPTLGKHQLYIKLKLVAIGPLTYLNCISFHIAEDRLPLPFRKEEKK